MKEMGFWFNYKNRHVSASKVINSVELRRYDLTKACTEDDVPLFVRCDKCDTFMDFISGHSHLLNGYWKCPVCGCRTHQRTVYRRLDDENFMDQDYND